MILLPFFRIKWPSHLPWQKRKKGVKEYKRIVSIYKWEISETKNWSDYKCASAWKTQSFSEVKIHKKQWNFFQKGTKKSRKLVKIKICEGNCCKKSEKWLCQISVNKLWGFQVDPWVGLKQWLLGPPCPLIFWKKGSGPNPWPGSAQLGLGPKLMN